VNTELPETGQRQVRLRALARLGEMAERGDFDEFAGDKAAYDRRPGPGRDLRVLREGEPRER
jgi:hypothetical protein